MSGNQTSLPPVAIKLLAGLAIVPGIRTILAPGFDSWLVYFLAFNLFRDGTFDPVWLYAAVTSVFVHGGWLHLLADAPNVEGRTLAFTQSQVWHWAMQSTHAPRRVTGAAVPIAPGTRCVALCAAATGKLQSVQVLMRLTGKISSRHRIIWIQTPTTHGLTPTVSCVMNLMTSHPPMMKTSNLMVYSR